MTHRDREIISSHFPPISVSIRLFDLYMWFRTLCPVYQYIKDGKIPSDIYRDKMMPTHGATVWSRTAIELSREYKAGKRRKRVWENKKKGAVEDRLPNRDYHKYS